eukprot:gene8212-16886_t
MDNNQLANENENALQRNEQPLRMFDYISRYIFVYIFITAISQKLLNKTTSNNVDIITPEKAFEINEKRHNNPDPENPLAKFINIKTPPKLNVFPTHDQHGLFLPSHSCTFRNDELMDLSVFITDRVDFDYQRDSSAHVWTESGLPFNWTAPKENWPRHIDLNITVTEELRNNGSLFAHVFFSGNGLSIVRFKPKKIVKELRKLLDKRDNPQTETETKTVSQVASDSISSTTMTTTTTTSMEEVVVDMDGMGVGMEMEMEMDRTKEEEGKEKEGGYGDNSTTNDVVTQPDNKGTDKGQGHGKGQGQGQGQVVGHWTPTLEVALVLDMPPVFPRNGVPASVAE